MKASRIMATSLVAVLIVALLAACTGVGSTPTAVATKAPATNAATDSPTAPPAPVEKPKITVYGPPNVEEFPAGENENNNRIINHIKELTGYDVEWVIGPREKTREAMNLIMASGDPPDMIYSGDKATFSDYTAQQLLNPVDAYIDSAQNIKTLVPESGWVAVEYNGEHFAVPVPQNQFASSGVIIRKDWYETLGSPSLATIDDYVAVLRQVKEKKLGGDNTIAYTARFAADDVFAYAYGLNVLYKPVDGALIATDIQPYAKQYLEFMAKLYKDGLLDSEYAVNTAQTMEEKMVNGTAFMETNGWTAVQGLERAAKEKNPAPAYAVIQPPKGIDGQPTYFNLNPPVRVYFMFPAESDKTKEAVAFLDRCTMDDIRVVISYGWEGEHYTKDDQGMIKQTEKAEQIRYRIYYNMWDTVGDFENRVKLKGFATGYFPMREFTKTEYVINYAPPIADLTEYSPALKDLKDEYFTKIITGAWGIEKFDEYVQKWGTYGGDAVIKAINDWYKDWPGKK